MMYYTECANPTRSRARLSLSANAVVIIKRTTTTTRRSPFLNKTHQRLKG